MRAGLIIPDIAEVERGGYGGRFLLGSANVSRSMPRNRMTSGDGDFRSLDTTSSSLGNQLEIFTLMHCFQIISDFGKLY